MRKILTLAGLTVFGLAVGVALGVVAIHDLAWADTGDLLGELDPLLVSGAVALTIAAGYLRGLRWKILLDPERITAARLYLIEQTGTALDTFSAVHVLDEVVETAILTKRDRIPVGKVLATLAMQRTLEFGATVLILGVLAITFDPLRDIRAQMVVAAVAGIVSVALLFTVGPNLVRVPFINRFGVTAGFAESTVTMRRRWQRSVIAFVMSVAQLLMVGIAGWMLAEGLDLQISIVEGVAITIGVLLFGSVVPGLPLAFGTYEFAAVSLFELLDRPSAEAVSFTLLLRINIYLIPLIMGAVFLSREGLVSFRSLAAMLRQNGSDQTEPSPPADG